MNYRQAKIVSRIIIFLIVVLALFGLYRCIKPAPTEPAHDNQPSAVASQQSEPPLPRVTDYNRQFNDLNDAHLEYAVKQGIQPIVTTKDILAMNKPVVEIKGCEDYYVSPLSHSFAFLVEPAADLLHDIGIGFNRRLAEKYPGADYKINVTSVLRTAESISRLKKRNLNSTENSAHLYGTTFDISYVKFPEGQNNAKQISDADLKMLLAEVLLGLKTDGRCLVKYERKQGCFHITTTGK